MQDTEKLLQDLRREWEALGRKKCSGTVAFLDLAGSTQFKVSFPAPDIWLERLYTFVELVRTSSTRVLGRAFIKYLGDGVLIFQKEAGAEPEKFITFVEELANEVALVNQKRYSSKLWTIEFKCSLDYGSDIYLLNGDDPQGTVVDRAYRINSYLMPNMVGVSQEFHERVNGNGTGRFVLAGRAYLKGVSERWQNIYSMQGIEGFSIDLNQEQKKKEALFDIWEMGKADKPIWVISGAMTDDDSQDIDTYAMQHGDSNALIEIIHTLSKLYPDREIRIVSSQDYLKQNGPAFDNDIVCVSGPAYNLVTEKAIGKLKLPISFEDDTSNPLRHDDSLLVYVEGMRKTLFSTERDRNQHITRDATFFAKIKDAFVQGRYFYLMMGNETQGTFAGTNLFGISSPYLLSNHEYMRSKSADSGSWNMRRFGILAKAEVIEHYVEPIQLSNCSGSLIFPV